MACTQQKQLVCFPKVRVPKKWFRYFNDHKDFRNEGTLHLFSLIGLYSYANYRSNPLDVSKGCEALCPEELEDYGFL